MGGNPYGQLAPRQGDRVVRLEELEGNLLNITPRSPIYRVFTRILERYLPEDLAPRYRENPLIQVIAVDNFFLHYSVYPLLRTRAEHPLLEAVRVFLEKYTASTEYARARRSTLLDEEASLIHTVTLTEHLLRLLSRKAGSPSDFQDTRETPGHGGEQSGEGGEMEHGDRASGDGESSAGEEGEGSEGEAVEGDEEAPGEGVEESLVEAVRKANRVAEAAKSVREVLGGGGAGVELGEFRKLMDLSQSLVDVRDAQGILELARATLQRMPRFAHLEKRVVRRGEEIRGYRVTGSPEHALPRELALPEELFMAKLAGVGFLSREMEESMEGTLYVLLDKCLPSNAMIAMDGGEEKPLGDVREGDEVLSVRIQFSHYARSLAGWRSRHTRISLEPARVVRVVDGGVKRVLGLRTAWGVLRASEDHLIPIVRDENIILVPASQARPGDRLLAWGRPQTVEEDQVSVYSGGRLVSAEVTGVELLGEERVLDIRLDRNHLFIADGFVVHNSGSMGGYKMIWSRSVALALYRVARARNRDFLLRMFDARLHPHDRPLEDPLEVLEALLKVPPGGGTRIAQALETAVEDIVERGLGDKTNTVVLITDGEDQVILDRRLLERAGVSLVTVMIAGENTTLKTLSDHYINAALDPEGALRLVGEEGVFLPRLRGRSRYRHA